MGLGRRLSELGGSRAFRVTMNFYRDAVQGVIRYN